MSQPRPRQNKFDDSIDSPSDSYAAPSGIDDENCAPTSTRHFVLASLCLAATIAYIGRNCLGVAESTIRAELDIPLVSMGWVMGAFFWSYALAQVPSGVLAQVWGTRRALSLYAALWSLICGSIGLATGLWTLVLAQLVFGIAQAGIFPCCGATIAKWIPESRRGLTSGFVGGFQSVGGAIGAALTGILLAGSLMGFAFGSVPWRGIFVLYALPGLAWAVWFYLWFRDRPEEHAAVNAAELALIHRKRESKGDNRSQKASGGVLRSLFDLFMLCSQQFFRGAGYIFFATWFPTFLQETRGVTVAQSGALTALPLLAVVLGAPLGGVLVDAIFNHTGSRRLSRQVVAIVAMLSCAVFIGLAYFVADALLAVLLISLGSFCAALGGPCGYTVTIDKGGNHVAPIFGVVNMTGNFGAAICPVVVALIVDTTGNWNVMLIFFMAIYLAAAACWTLLNPNGTFFGTQR
jgi:sugar phosphate permease